MCQAIVASTYHLYLYAAIVVPVSGVISWVMAVHISTLLCNTVDHSALRATLHTRPWVCMCLAMVASTYCHYLYADIVVPVSGVINWVMAVHLSTLRYNTVDHSAIRAAPHTRPWVCMCLASTYCHYLYADIVVPVSGVISWVMAVHLSIFRLHWQSTLFLGQERGGGGGGVSCWDTVTLIKLLPTTKSCTNPCNSRLWAE